MKQAILSYVWNQPVLSNEGKVSCSRKQREHLMGLNSRLSDYHSGALQTVLMAGLLLLPYNKHLNFKLPHGQSD